MGKFQQSASLNTLDGAGQVGHLGQIGETTDMFSDLPLTSRSSVSAPLAVAPSAAPTVNSPGASFPVNNAPSSDAGGARRVVKLDTGASKSSSSKQRAKRKKVAQFDHLAAARKLQWQLRRARSHSPEEMKTGRMICRHLLALLNEAANTAQVPNAQHAQNDAQNYSAGYVQERSQKSALGQ